MLLHARPTRVRVACNGDAEARGVVLGVEDASAGGRGLRIALASQEPNPGVRPVGGPTGCIFP